MAVASIWCGVMQSSHALTWIWAVIEILSVIRLAFCWPTFFELFSIENWPCGWQKISVSRFQRLQSLQALSRQGKYVYWRYEDFYCRPSRDCNMIVTHQQNDRDGGGTLSSIPLIFAFAIFHNPGQLDPQMLSQRKGTRKAQKKVIG